MGRLVRDANLSTREARKRLKPRSKPYWRLLEHGRHIGYRKTRSGGSWLARLYKGERKYIEEGRIIRRYAFRRTVRNAVRSGHR